MSPAIRRPLWIGTFLFAASPLNLCWGDEGTCLKREEHEWVKAKYDDLVSRYDLATVARRLLELNNEAEALKDQASACGKDASGGQRCTAVRRELQAKLEDESSTADLLNTALEMQTYILTLQVRLERPVCER